MALKLMYITDKPEVAKIADSTIARRILTYGLNAGADVSCSTMELNENGGDITISKEIDIIEPTKTFRDLLLEHIDLYD